MSRIGDAAVALAIVILLSSYTDARRRRVDCTKFVFAPVCRGIAAKRGDIHLQSSQSLEKPDWRFSRRIPIAIDEYSLKSPSLKDSMMLSKLLMTLSNIDTENGSAERDAQLHLNPGQDRISQSNKRILGSPWLEN